MDEGKILPLYGMPSSRMRTPPHLNSELRTHQKVEKRHQPRRSGKAVFTSTNSAKNAIG